MSTAPKECLVPQKNGFRIGCVGLVATIGLFLVAGCEPASTGEPLKSGDQQKPIGGYPAAHEERVDRSHAGSPAPNTLFQDPAGEPASIPQFLGKPVLLNLWATWCGPCVVEMPTLDALAAREQNITVLVVSQDLDENNVRSFFDQRQFNNLQPHIDTESTLMKHLQTNTLPTTILYDRSGREIWRLKGMLDWQGKAAAKLISEATEVATPSRAPRLLYSAS